MALSFALHRKIVDFLISLPNVNDSSVRQALVHRAMLDAQLQSQIRFSEPSANFFELLVPQLIQYGQLEDGRNALEAILEAAKGSVGPDRREYCNSLIQQSRAGSNVEEHPPSSDIRLGVQLLLEGDIQDFNEIKHQALITVIAEILHIERPSIRISHVIPARSFYVIIELPIESALELFALFETKSKKIVQLEEQFSVKGINIVGGEDLDLLPPHHLDTPKSLSSLLPDHWFIKAIGGIVAYVTFLGVLRGILPDPSRNELFGLYSIITGLVMVICLIVILITLIARRLSETQKGAEKITSTPIDLNKRLAAKEKFIKRLAAKRELTKILSTWLISGGIGIVLFLWLMSPSPLTYVYNMYEYTRAFLQRPTISIRVQYENGESTLVSKGEIMEVRSDEKTILTVELPGFSENFRNNHNFYATYMFGELKPLSPYKFEYIAPKDKNVDIITISTRISKRRLEQAFNVTIQK